VHYGFCRVHDWTFTWSGRQEMIPYGLNGHYHYADCEAKLNSDPDCHCVGNMAKQISVLAEECKRLMQKNRTLESQLRRASNG
jgi:hypothetical protein